MLGGLMGFTRELESEGAYGAFEQALERVMGAAVRESDAAGVELWSALANVDWAHPTHGELGYSFRAAGDLVAALKGSGDYMVWYCSGPYATVSDRIAEGMGREGWTWKVCG